MGILASLRAVQHALLNHDSTLSPEHKKAIEAWKKSTPFDGPEITFIKNSRDLILKGGALQTSPQLIPMEALEKVTIFK